MLGVLFFGSNARATATTHTWAPSTDFQAFNDDVVDTVTLQVDIDI